MPKAHEFTRGLAYTASIRVHNLQHTGCRQVIDGLFDFDDRHRARYTGHIERLDLSYIQAVATPGHTSGSTSFLIDGSFLATGDSLFVESVARPDLEAGDAGAPEAATQLYESLNSRIRPLPGDTVIGGAHYSPGAEPATDGTYSARLASLVSDLDAFSMDRETFVDWVLDDMPPRPANYEAIIDANLGKTDLDDDAAFELELGPNNCAASRESITAD